MSEDNESDKSKAKWGTWAGGPDVSKPKTGMSRRDFLKTAGVAAGAMGTSGPVGDVIVNLARFVDSSSLPQTEGEWPDDIVPRGELHDRFRTVIHDLPESEFPGDFVELNFRRSIEDLRLFQMLEGDNPRLIGLDVVLVNGEYIDPQFFTPDQRSFLEQFPTILNGLDREQARIRERSADLVQLAYSPTLGTGTNDRGENGPRNFIFLAVRGDMAPRPEQSYPAPEDFNVSGEANVEGYIVNTRTAGNTFWHEAAHSRGVYGETDADRAMLDMFSQAATHMAETGSDEKYPAVFRTPEGFTITKSNNVPGVI